MRWVQAKNIFIFIFLAVLVMTGAHARMFERTQKTLFDDRKISYGQSWVEIGDTEDAAIAKLIELLQKSKTGAQLLARATAKAREQGDTLLDVIRPGDGSLTDTTLVRKFSQDNPEHMVFESRSKVFINRRLTVMDGLLDMAHELVHFSFRGPFNPYKRGFGVRDFVVSTVEGKGGEVDAYLVECQVLLEVFPRQARERTNCAKVMDDKTGRPSKELGIAHFYRMGRYFQEFQKDLGPKALAVTDFPHISSDDAIFISSAWGLPYPLAALKEYEGIMGRVCENDYKRLSLMKQRAPASADHAEMSDDYRDRCASFGPLLN
jgi:hypothetical protein